MTGVTQVDPDPNESSAGARWAARMLPLVLLVGLAVKLGAILAFSHHGPDALAIKGWCMDLARRGVSHLYDDPDALTRHPPYGVHPLFALVLWPFALIWKHLDPGFVMHGARTFTVWVRLPSLLAECASALILWRMASRWASPKVALGVVAAFFLNPATTLGLSVWGSSEALLLMLVLGSVLALVERRFALAVLLAGLSGLVNVFAFALVPVVAAAAVARGGARHAAVALAGVAIATVAVCFTLSPTDPTVPLIAQVQVDDFTTHDAFNAWFPLGNMDRGSTPLIPRVPGSRHVWSAGVILLLVMVTAFRTATRLEDSDYVRDLVLMMLGAWLFSTRMHPQYAILPLTLLGLFPGHRATYCILSLVAALNVIWPMGLSANWGAAVMGGWGNFLSAVNLVLFLRLSMTASGDAEVQLYEEKRLQESLEADLSPKGPDAVPDNGIVRLDLKDLAVMLILLVAFGYLRHVNLAAPPDQIFDEVYHAKAADEIWHGKAPNEWVHPPLAKILIGFGIKWFGMDSYGWRFVPWLAGCFVLPILYVLARNVIPDRRCALIGTLLFAFDGCYFVLSRTAMTNVFAVLWQVSAITCFLLYLKQASVRGGRFGYGGWLFVTGILCGIGISTRWTCLWLIAFISGLYALHTTWHVYHKTHAPERSTPVSVLVYLLAALSGLVHFYLMPGAMYLASYYPLVKSGAYPDWDYVVSLQPQIWIFHSTFTTNHPYYSQWYTWCFTYRPVWYHYKDVEGTIHGILALGNPILWWASLPGVIAAAWLGIKERSWMAGFACISWAALYVPWMLSPRVLNYSHYYLEPMPYACLAMAWLASVMVRRDRSFWVETTAALLIVACSFAFFYPILSCTPLPRKSYDMRIWSRTWI